MRAVWAIVVGVAVISGCETKDPPLQDWVDSGVRCQDPSDQALIQSWIADAGPEAGPLSDPGLLAAFACGREPECLGPLYNNQIDAGSKCVDDCMTLTVAGGLSQDCRHCYIYNGLLCAGFYCLTECVATNEGCEPCFQEQCQGGLYHCTDR